MFRVAGPWPSPAEVAPTRSLARSGAHSRSDRRRRRAPDSQRSSCRARRLTSSPLPPDAHNTQSPRPRAEI